MNDEANRNLAQHDAPEQIADRFKMGRLSRLAWLPIPVLLATMLALRAADLRTSHESLNLLISLNFGFSTLASLAVAFLMGRAFLVQPSPGMLMVGCGVLIWGVGSFLAPLVERGNANVIVTIHNLCVWLAACSHLASVSISGRLRQVVAAQRRLCTTMDKSCRLGKAPTRSQLLRRSSLPSKGLSPRLSEVVKRLIQGSNN